MMSYNSATVASVVDQINRSYFLPAIQRPYVWEPDQVVALFDSLLKGYPISTFLFWEVKPENRRNWQIYSFAEQFKYGEIHNEQVEPDGRDVVLVLDGQQRLTSLLIGLRGSYTIKLKNKRWDNPAAWVKQRMYIDLFKDPGTEDTEDREDLGITYGLKFSAEKPKSDERHLWYKVGDILDFDDEDQFHKHVEDILDRLPETITKGQLSIARRTMQNLYRKIWKDEVISYYMEKNQSYDRVLDIFIRANDGGTKLSKSDLLLSMITSKWNGIDAREEIYDFVERLNNGLDRRNNFEKDFVMRSCLLISDLDHIYKVGNFTNDALATIQEKWPDIRAAIERTIRLVNGFGIDRDTLTSVNALLPIAYYLSKIDRALDGSTSFEVRSRELIRRWLLGALLNGVFGGNSDQTLGVARQVIKEACELSDDFPYAVLCEALLRRRGRIVGFDANNLDALLGTRYTQRTCFLALSVLYDEHNWGSTLYHIDHIIPKSLCTKANLQGRGLSEEKITKIVSSVDQVGNLQLLHGRENLEKGNVDFGEWIDTREPNFLQRHLIPASRHLWKPEMLLEFIAAREALIRDRMRSFAPPLRAAGSEGAGDVGESLPAAR